ncbi:MAG: recombinase family protein [Bacilli bacterium]
MELLADVLEKTKKVIYKVAIYIRISKEDEKGETSESVINQKSLLVKYVNEHGYKIFDIYIDDGYTGTNFNRPAFKKMINDIETKLVNMVITKDLSRLGRDYITTGEYVEKWFPKHHVRYVSLLDGIDTFLDSSNNEIAPFKAIINDMYSKDNSKKIKAALKSLQEEGKWVGGCPPFGYKVSPNNKNHLIINEEEASIVKKIFNLALTGITRNQIINILFNEKISTPTMIRKINRNFKYACLGYWNATTIKSILTNDLYTGDMVQNRRSRISYKIRQVVPNDPSKWIKVENTHDAIISKKDFNEVKKLLNINKGLRGEKKVRGIYDGLIYCYECKHRIAIQGGNVNNNCRQFYTVCNTYRKYSKLKICTSHSNNFLKLEERINNELRRLFNSCISQKNTYNNLLRNKESILNTLDLSLTLKKLINEVEIKNKNLDKMYIEKLEGKISDEMYKRISESIMLEIKIIEKKKDIIIKNIYNNKLLVDNKKCLTLVKEFLCMNDPSREFALKLIKRIELHQDKTIDIYLNFKCCN